MKLSNQGLRLLLAQHVVELVFARRHKKPSYGPVRRMLCTNNFNLLNSIPGLVTLKFKKPSHPPPFNTSVYNLVTTWDIIMCDYRNVSLDTYEVVGVYPIKNEKEIQEFWSFFVNTIYNLSTGDKIKYLDNRMVVTSNKGSQ